MPDLDLSALRKVAEAAVQGPREVAAWDPRLVMVNLIGRHSSPSSSIHHTDNADAEFTTRFGPATVLALLDALETLRELTKPPEVGFSSVGSGPIKGVQLRQVSDG